MRRNLTVNTMQHRLFITVLFLLLLVCAGAFSILSAQSPRNKTFGIGAIVGEPFGVTVKTWLGDSEALDFNFGRSCFGSPRIDVNYVWHLTPSDSRHVFVLCGPGLVIGVGYGNSLLYEEGEFFDKKSGEVATGIRAMFGLMVVPGDLPFEVSVEFASLVSVSPGTDASVDIALGLRFYP